MRWLIGLIALTLVSFAGCGGGADRRDPGRTTRRSSATLDTGAGHSDSSDRNTDASGAGGS